jgi:hypothetical protein
MFGGADPVYCPTVCTAMFAARNPPQEPCCDTCTDERKRVELLPENEQAAKIFLMCRGQCECRWNGEQDIEIDLHHPSLWKAIEKYPGGVKDEWGTFQKVNRAWHESQRKKRDNEG